jgi:symplekin
VAAATAAAAAATAAAQPAVLNPDTAPLGIDEDDDDYEPDFYAAEDTEQILNKLDGPPPEEPPQDQNAETDTALTALATFKLPPPPSLDPEAAVKVGQIAAARVFGPLSTLEEPAVLRKPKAGINRLAASSYDRDSWLTLITRLATRSSAGLEDASSGIKPEDALDQSRMTLGTVIRELLYNYVLEDFRRRIETAVAWLCEEWYNDQITKRSKLDGPLHYEKCAQRLLDGFLPYLTAQDKILTRFLAEIPELSRALLGRLTALCRDPTTVQLALTSLLYLAMMRPPVREIALDTVQDIWIECKSTTHLAA